MIPSFVFFYCNILFHLKNLLKKVREIFVKNDVEEQIC